MKTIEVDDELYSYIASHTKHIGERIRHFTAYVEVFPPRRSQQLQLSGEGDACGATGCEAETGQPVRAKFARWLSCCCLTNMPSEKRSTAHALILTTSDCWITTRFAEASCCMAARASVTAADEQTLLRKMEESN